MMKRHIYNENTKEIDIVKQKQIKKSKKIKRFLKRNKIFFQIFSSFFLGIMGIVISFVGVNINNRIMEIYERQLEIEEKNMEPYFTLEYENVWKKVEKTEGADKIAKYKYTLTNNGGNITNVSVEATAYILFYIPTEVEDEWYIFKYETTDFKVNRKKSNEQEERDGKFIFYEYTSEENFNESIDRNAALGKYLADNLNGRVMHKVKRFLRITYTDYMGEEKIKLFEFSGSDLWEIDKEIEGVSVGVGLNAINYDQDGKNVRIPIDISNNAEVGKAIKEDIEDWMEKNNDKKGYKISSYVWHDYNKFETESSGRKNK